MTSAQFSSMVLGLTERFLDVKLPSFPVPWFLSVFPRLDMNDNKIYKSFDTTRARHVEMKQNK